MRTHHCARCGAALRSDAQGTLCPACVLESGLGSATEMPTAGDTLAAPAHPPPGRPPQQFGDYELLDEIARGGQGVVYRARHRTLHRIVALKMIPLGPWATDTHLRRFRTEAEAAATLDHPQIVPIYEVGCIEGQHYFTMRLVEGGSLKEMAAGSALASQRAAQIIAAAARAIHFAHQRGILHRDLKPGNILLDSNDQPHVTDFGLAKLVEQESTITNTMDVLGTPSYMSPEQAAGHAKQLTTAADVYGLGAVLYELLTGHPPFAGGTTLETIRLVFDNEPSRPSLWNPKLDSELEIICLKCLEKEPSRRYRSAEALAEDLERWLHHEPILARPLGPAGRLWRWCRRKPVVASLSAATILLVLAVAIGSPVAAFRIAAAREAERRAAQRAEQKTRELQHAFYVADINVAYHAIQENNLGLATTHLDKYLPRTESAHSRGPAQLQAHDLLGWEWRYLWSLCQGEEESTSSEHTNFVSCVVFSPDNRLLATAGDESVKVRDAQSKNVLATLGGFNEWIDQRAVAFSPDGQFLAAKGGSIVLIWKVGEWGSPYLTLEGAKNFNFNNAVQFWPDSRTFATRVAGGVGVWDTTTWQRSLLKGGDSFGTVLEFSRNGGTLAISDWNTLQIRDAKSLQAITNLVQPAAAGEEYVFRVMSADFSPRHLAAGYRNGALRLWEAGSWKECALVQAHPSFLWALAFSPDGKTLATGGSDQVILLWDVATLKADAPSAQPFRPKKKLKGHAAAIWALAFTSDGQTLVSGSLDGTVKYWDGISTTETRGLANSRDPVWFSSNATQMLTLNHDGRLHSWNTSTQEDSAVLGPRADGGPVKSRAISVHGRWFALGMTNGAVEVWNLVTGQLEKQFHADDAPIDYLAFSPTNGCLAAASDRLADTGWQGTVRIWDLAGTQGKPAHVFENTFGPLAFSSDGGRLVSSQVDGSVVLWEISTHRPLAYFRGHWEWIRCVAFSPDDRLLATGSGDTTARLWDVLAGKERYVLRGSRTGIGGLQFSPDGKTLVTTTMDNSSKLWNVATGKELFTIEQGIPSISLLFSPDNQFLALVGNAGDRAARQVELLRAPSFAEIEAVERTRRSQR